MASVRLCTRSFWNDDRRWVFTVVTEMFSRAAIRLLHKPVVTRDMTSASRIVNGSALRPPATLAATDGLR